MSGGQTVRELIAEAASTEFAGAFRILRRVDPLWQAEIGEEREWQASYAEYITGRCDCPHCDGCGGNVKVSSRLAVFEAVTAAEAFRLAEGEVGCCEELEGVRLLGSNTDFFEPAEETLQ